MKAKSKRPGTRSGRRAESIGVTEKNEIPDDLPDAAEAALDDLLSGGTQERSVSLAIDLDVTGLDDAEPGDEILAAPPPAKRQPPAPPPKKRAATAAPIARPPTAAELPARPAPKTVPPPMAARPAPAKPIPAPVRSAPGTSPPPLGRPTPLPAPLTARSNGSALPSADEALAALDFDDDLVPSPAVTEMPQLRFAIYEQPEHLAACTNAIVAAGHVVTAGASGTANLSKIADEVVSGLDVVIVALPGGEPVIDIALAQEPRRPIVIAAVSGKNSDAVASAIAIGADLALTRPHDPERIAPMLLAAARLHEEKRLGHNARGNESLLRAKIEELTDPDIRGLQPFETFQRVLELEFKRAKRFEYPLSVALFAVEVPPPPPPAGIRGILRARAGNALIQTIRDIDLATQLDHERFLVLLPYTDLSGATALGRRLIAAVAKGEPVISGGRSFTPRVVGAVAGARPGQELSFSRLMKDATTALAQARKDGAELAVQPSL